MANDLPAAIAAAREVARARDADAYSRSYLQQVVIDLLAALDAAQPVAWRYRVGLKWYVSENKPDSVFEYNEIKEYAPLYLAPPAPPAAVPAVHVFNCHRCPVSVEARWQPPECPECGDPCALDTSAKPAPVAAQKGYTLVPVEPTEAMLLAGGRSLIDGQENRAGFSWAEEAGMCFAAMLAANKENNND